VLPLGLTRKPLACASRRSIDSSLNSVVQREAVGATRMRGQRLGLVGMGRIGTSVALKARAFGFAVSFYDPALPDGVEKALGGVGRFESAAALLEHSDCVSMHCTLNPTSRQLLDAPALRRLPAGALVVNTARGGLIDDSALAAALADGRLGGAAIDCQEAEPHLARSAYVQLLRSRPELNLIVTPHCAFYSDQSVVDMRAMACAEARRALQLDASEWTSAAQAVAAVASTLRNCVNGRELVASHAEAVWHRWGGYKELNDCPTCPTVLSVRRGRGETARAHEGYKARAHRSS
jgi:C-terminal binding protein